MRIPISPGMPINDSQRWLLGGWSLFLVFGFGLSCWLTPDPRGFGTHQQLGLPPCSFRLFFGTICPSCGGTTCFAYFVRGQWGLALAANPAIFLFASLCAVTIPWSWVSIYRRRTVGLEDPVQFLALALVLICGLALLQWGWRMLWI